MHRRSLIAAGAAAPLAWAWVRPAGAAESRADAKPYLQVKPVPGEGGIVRVFFSPSCAFSKAYVSFFRNLQATLPESMHLAYSPLVNKMDGVGYALAFEAVAARYPGFVDNFVEASMLGVQEHGLGPSNWRALERIGRAARLPVSLPELVRDQQRVARAAVDAALDRQRALAVTNTPTVTVNGTYVVTPEFTNGDPQLFSQLVNGVISMVNPMS